MGCHLSDLGLRHAAELAQLPLRGHHNPGVGGFLSRLQHNHGKRLRLSQPETRQWFVLGPAWAVAVLRTRRGRYRRRGLGADDLALGDEAAESSVSDERR